MTLEDATNKVIIPGHYGPHPEAYHREIFRRLTDATRGKKGDAYKQALLNELKEVEKLAKKPGTTLNRLLAE